MWFKSQKWDFPSLWILVNLRRFLFIVRTTQRDIEKCFRMLCVDMLPYHKSTQEFLIVRSTKWQAWYNTQLNCWTVQAEAASQMHPIPYVAQYFRPQTEAPVGSYLCSSALLSIWLRIKLTLCLWINRDKCGLTGLLNEPIFWLSFCPKGGRWKWREQRDVVQSYGVVSLVWMVFLTGGDEVYVDL